MREYLSHPIGHIIAIILSIITFIGVMWGCFNTHNDLYVALPLGLVNALILTPIAYGIGRVAYPIIGLGVIFLILKMRGTF